jgi:hypothetical protein
MVLAADEQAKLTSHRAQVRQLQDRKVRERFHSCPQGNAGGIERAALAGILFPHLFKL